MGRNTNCCTQEVPTEGLAYPSSTLVEPGSIVIQDFHVAVRLVKTPTSNAGGLGSIPGWEPKSHRMHGMFKNI